MPFWVLSGPTGSAKTHLLEALSEELPVIDLEKAALHRGSAFGAIGERQPTQINFENDLAVQVLRVLKQKPDGQKILIEDESRMIGQCVVPEELFSVMRKAPVLYVEETLESRVENIFLDYISSTAIGSLQSNEGNKLFTRYRNSIQQISKKLGGLRTQELLQDLLLAQSDFNDRQGLELNRIWIRKLLEYYYDPLYAQSFVKRNPEVAFRGTGKEVLQFIYDFGSGAIAPQ